MESRLPMHKEKIMLSAFREMNINENDSDVQNVSMESIAMNKKSYFRIFEGVRMSYPLVNVIIQQAPFY